jgi:hypothetical protein
MGFAVGQDLCLILERQRSNSHPSSGYTDPSLSPLFPLLPMAYNSARDKLAYFKDNKQTQENQVNSLSFSLSIFSPSDTDIDTCF